MKFVQEYEAYHDAQALYCYLLETYQHGIQGELHQENIIEDIQNLQLISSWSRTLEYFKVTFEHKLQDNAQRKCKTNKATKANSRTKEVSKNQSNSAKSSDTQLLPKDVWAKMTQEECSKHIEKFCNKTKSISRKSSQANGTGAANGSKITNSNDSTPQTTSSDYASATGPSDTPPGSMLYSLLSFNKANLAGTKETRLAPGTNMAQIYTGITSHFTKVYPLSSE